MDRFEDFKTSVEADSDSDGLRRAVDLAHETEIEVGARPKALQKDVERLEGENEQLRERLEEKNQRLDEKDEQIEELKEENERLGAIADRLNYEAERLRSKSPLQQFRNIAVGLFVLGTFGFISVLVGGPMSRYPFLDQVVLVSLTGMLAGALLILLYVPIYLFKALLPERYARATKWFFSLPVVRRVIDVEKWAPDNDRPARVRYHATGKK